MATAVHATFARRNTSKLAPWPVALTAEFYEDVARAAHWQHFLERVRLDEPPRDFAIVGARVRDFFHPLIHPPVAGVEELTLWPAGGPWQ